MDISYGQFAYHFSLTIFYLLTIHGYLHLNLVVLIIVTFICSLCCINCQQLFACLNWVKDELSTELSKERALLVLE